MATPAAFHGPGWKVRQCSLADDVAVGEYWSPCGADSEWQRLRSVVLSAPDLHWRPPSDWNAVQYLRPVDFASMRAELDALAHTFFELDVDVTWVPGPHATRRGTPLYNSVFARDQFFITPQGAIVARMASIPRAGEERLISAALTTAGIPILHTISGAAHFEGADALWLRPDLVVIGVGNRTNLVAAEEIAGILDRQAVATMTIPMPRAVQHLLGLLQLVGPDCALVRTDHAPPQLLDLLRSGGITIVPVADTSEIVEGQALNVVVLAERTVLMLPNRPQTRRQLIKCGIEPVESAPCPQLLCAAGGLGCAAGILLRAHESR